MKYRNPIIPGFNPDPSIILHDGTFYLVTSSFHIFPGLPIYASKDLASWTQIGNAIDRPSQLDLSGATTRATVLDTGKTMVATAGLWAPTIRFHKGTFCILCTNCIRTSAYFEKKNFYITCIDILANEWSDPIYFYFDVIDPSLFFDDDDRAYIQGSWNLISRKVGEKKTQPSCTLKQIEVDIETGKVLVLPREIWAGFAKVDSEGPHIYKKDGWYYLLAAEGGTFEHHLLSIARSRNIWGPYESYEHNPILTADGKDEYIQNTGHGDLFQDQQGAWWAVVLAIRNKDGRSPLGRETFLTPVTWPENGWPEFAQPKMEFERESAASMSTDELLAFKKQHSPLHEIVYIRNPALETYKISPDTKSVSLQAGTTDITTFEGSPSFIGRRQTALECSVTATLLLTPGTTILVAGLTVYKDSFRHAEIFLDFKAERIVFKLVNGTREAGEAMVETDFNLDSAITKVEFKIQATRKSYAFAYRKIGEEWVEMHVFDAMEMTARDFTGTLFGVFACGDEGSKEEVVRFEGFEQSLSQVKSANT